jgi:hypothetical protein
MLTKYLTKKPESFSGFFGSDGLESVEHIGREIIRWK